MKLETKNNVYTKDEYGKDILIGFASPTNQVMMEWEKEYMQKCIQKLNPFGDVLEVGFGLAYSASEIQKYNINSHTIIECDPECYEKALEWAKKQKNKTRIVFGNWQDVYKSLGKFDCFFFDPCPDFICKEYDLNLLIPEFDQYDLDFLNIYESITYSQFYYMYDSFELNFSFISEMLKYNSKDFAKFSFYVVSPHNLKNSSIKEHFNRQFFYQNPNYSCEIYFDTIPRNVVPDNCNYVDDESTIYVPLVTSTKTKYIYY